jgi:hypothetical protein
LKTQRAARAVFNRKGEAFLIIPSNPTTCASDWTPYSRRGGSIENPASSASGFQSKKRSLSNRPVQSDDMRVGLDTLFPAAAAARLKTQRAARAVFNRKGEAFGPVQSDDMRVGLDTAFPRQRLD